MSSSSLFSSAADDAADAINAAALGARDARLAARNAENGAAAAAAMLKASSATLGGVAPAQLPGGGVKGSDVYSTTGAVLVDLSALLVRGLAPERIAELVAQHAEDTARREALSALAAAEAWEDAFVLAFQCRDVRGGKGERDLFRELFFALRGHQPRLADALLPLVPEYGYWEDGSLPVAPPPPPPSEVI